MSCSIIALHTNALMFCVIYNSIQKFTIIAIIKTGIFIEMNIIVSMQLYYLNQCTALCSICTIYGFDCGNEF